MEKIKEIIIVEGKDDLKRIKESFDCTVIETKGFALKIETIKLLKKALKYKGIIILTDSDKSGNIIRQKIVKHLGKNNKIKHAYLNTKDTEVESVNKTEIIKIIKEVGTLYKDNQKDLLTLSDLLELDLAGENSKENKQKIQKHLCLGHGNNKKLLERLNYFKITKIELKKQLALINSPRRT
ncbi:ribonuclease M5 [Borreliella yangtzensis]|uniref:ribonuclease M5 n=1 Tax=Borreliella yangtzensis TaxID=683292 RepID=UPI001606DE8B|nr:ribonuclease M5 [Borreliella yangtzensis]WKC73577.1 ribonuclease M5 [Borreliella yangtzensis]WKC74492.1 ribonuclease M5 [Borreliella yangtzensis]